MHFRRFVVSGLIAVLFALLAGCGGMRDHGTPTFLLPVLDAGNNASFQKVELPTLHSPYRTEGGVAQIYFNPDTSGGTFNGPVAAPHLAKSGDLYIPLDAESGSVLSAYYFFERIYLYEQRVLVSQDVDFPRRLAIFKNVQGLSAQMENNAFYMGGSFDEYALLPYSDPNRVALVFNDGVLGHEHFHAHFEKLVNARMPELATVNSQDVAKAYSCPQTALQYEILVVRSWNEGFADFYGAVTSGNPNFMTVSIAPGNARILRAPPERMQTRSDLQASSAFHCVGSDPYKNGKQIARVLLAIADGGEFPAVLAATNSFSGYERAARFLIYRLKDLAADLEKKSWATLDPEYALSYILRGVKLSTKSCTIVELAVGDYLEKGFPQCAGS